MVHGKDVTLEEQMRIADIASTLRRSSERVEALLDGTKREELIELQLESAELRGETLTRAQIEAAIDSVVNDSYSFNEPEAGLKNNLFHIWVNRGYHIKTKVVLPAIGVGVLGLGALGFKGLKQAARNKDEARVEKTVEQLFGTHELMVKRLEVYQKNPLKDPLWNVELSQHLMSATGHLEGIDQFLLKFCPEGNSKENVTQENYQSVEEQVGVMAKAMRKAADDYKHAHNLVRAHDQSLKIHASLDTLIEGIRKSDAPKFLDDKAESSYKIGKAALEGRNVEGAKKEQSNLTSLTKDIQAFKVLPNQIEQVYASIQNVVKEDEARKSADKIYSDAKHAKNNANISEMREAHTKLQDLNQQLQFEYKLVIVNRTGQRTCVWRRDNSTGRVSGHYVIVEPIYRGRALSVPVWDHEETKTIKASIWGELIPKSVYDAMGRDKSDNGHMDTNNGIFAVKEKGYRYEKITFPGLTDNGNKQITRW